MSLFVVTGCGKKQGTSVVEPSQPEQASSTVSPVSGNNSASSSVVVIGNEQTSTSSPMAERETGTEDMKDWQTYRNEEYGFEFSYPNNWFLENDHRANILSPQKIEYYETGSNNAPITFGVYTKDQSLFLKNEDYLKFPEYEIKNCKRNEEDSVIKIDNKDFQRYDLTDYGRYEGASAGNVVYIISPEFQKGNDRLNIIFEWEEFPGAQKLQNNDKSKFLDIISTF